MNDSPQQALRQHDVEMTEYYRARTFWQSRANLRHLPHTFGEYPGDLHSFAKSVRETWPQTKNVWWHTVRPSRESTSDLIKRMEEEWTNLVGSKK